MIGLLYRASDSLRRYWHASDPGRPGASSSALSRAAWIYPRRAQLPPPAGCGETDLASGLARDTLVLVDVKTRTKTEFGAADRAVDAEKRQPLWQPHAITPRRFGVDPVAGPFDIVSIVLATGDRVDSGCLSGRSGSLITAAPAVRL